MNLTLGEIAAACGGKLVLQGDKASVNSCVSSVDVDSRKVEAGGVFIATVGEQVDGHRFIVPVFAQGGILAVTQKTPEQVETEHGCKASEWGSYVLVEDTLQALKEIGEAYRKKLHTKIVGLTGSSGKTTTKEFIAGVLAERYRVLKTEGNYNNEIGVPLTLLRIRDEHEVAVVEMGISDFGEMHRLSKMARPNVCVITNIGQSHLKDLKSRDGILKAKSEIFDFMAEDGEICFNGEDDKLSTLKEIKGHKPHFFGLGENPLEEVVAEEIVCHGLEGSDAILRLEGRVAASINGAKEQPACEKAGETPSVRVPIHVPQPGIHMVLNAAAAACVAGLFGLTGDEIRAGIARVGAVGGRTNIIRLPQYTLVDDCYNANPESMRAAIDLLALAETKKVAILGDMFNLGEDYDKLHGQMGIHAVEAGIDHIICVGEASQHMFQAAMDEVKKAGSNKAENNTVENNTAENNKVENSKAEGAEPSSGSRAGEESQQPVIMYFPHRQALLERLSSHIDELIPEGSTVLIKASHGMEFTEVLDFLRSRS